MSGGEAGQPSGERAAVTGRGAVRSGLVLFTGQAATAIVSGLGTLALAAFLEPDDFGIVAAALLVVGAFQTTLNLGVDAAVQALGPSTERDRTALTLSLALGSALSATTFVLAPVILAALQQPQALNILRALSVTLLLGPWSAVRKSLVERDLAFGRPAVISIIAAVAGVVVGLAAVWRGQRAWAIAIQLLVTEAVQALGYVVWTGGVRYPGWDRGAARDLWGYGRKLLRNSFYVFTYNNVDDVVVSRLGGTGALGLYSLAYRVANVPVRFFTHTAQRLMLPLLGALRRQGRSPAPYYTGQLRLLAVGVGLVMFGLMFHGGAVLTAVYGDRWSDASSTLQVLSVYGLFRSVGATTGAVFLTSGRPDLVSDIARWQTLGMLVVIVPSFQLAGITGAAAAVTLPLVVATIVALGIASPMVGVSRKVASAQVARGWLAALVANGMGWFVRASFEGWPGLVAGGLTTLTVFGLIFATAFRDEFRLLTRGARAATEPQVPASAPASDR